MEVKQVDPEWGLSLEPTRTSSYVVPVAVVIFSITIVMHPILLLGIHRLVRSSAAAGTPAPASRARRENPRDRFLQVLLTTQLASTLIHVIFTGVDELTGGRDYEGSKLNSRGAVQGSLLCGAQMAIGNTLDVSSWILHACLAWAIKRRVVDDRQISARPYLTFWACIVVIPMVGAFGIMLQDAEAIGVNFMGIACMLRRDYNTAAAIMHFIMLNFVLVCSAVIIYSVASLAIFLQRLRSAMASLGPTSEAQERAKSRDRSAVLMFVLICVMFVSTQVPFLVSVVLASDPANRIPGGRLAELSVLVLLSGRVVDGILLVTMSSRYRKGLRMVARPLLAFFTRLVGGEARPRGRSTTRSSSSSDATSAGHPGPGGPAGSRMSVGSAIPIHLRSSPRRSPPLRVASDEREPAGVELPSLSLESKAPNLITVDDAAGPDAGRPEMDLEAAEVHAPHSGPQN